MNPKLRIAILIALGIVVVGILVFPNFNNFNKTGGEGFSVTPNPVQALADVKGKGKPVVLEFYASW